MASTDGSYEFAPHPPGEGEGGGGDKTAHAPLPVPIPELMVERQCPHCGYKMVGKARARCPECSAALDLAAADLLQFSSAVWVRSIAMGPLMIALATLLFMGAASLLWMTDSYQAAVFSYSLFTIAAAAASAGIFIVTTGEGAGGGPQRRPLMALLARWSSLAACALFALALIFVAIHHEPVARGCLLGALPATAFTAFSLGFFLNALAARIPSDGLASQFQNLAWIIPVLILIVFVGEFIDLHFYFSMMFFCSFPLVGALIGLMLWSAAMFVRFTLELRSVAAAAYTIAEKRTQRAMATKPGASASQL